MLKRVLAAIFTCFYVVTFSQIILNYTSTTGSIPDNQTWKSFPITVTGLTHANIDSTFGLDRVTLSITHPSDYDLEAHLVAPDGTDVLLFSYLRYSGANFSNTNFKNTYTTSIETQGAPYSGNFHAQGDLGRVNNHQVGNGTWYLKVRDNIAGNAGSLTSCQIHFSAVPALAYTPVSSNLPIIKIDTHNQDIPDDPKVLALFQVIDNGIGQRNFVTDSNYAYQGNIGIEIRGSSSATFPKLEYGFETWDSAYNQIDTTILGMPAESDWVLQANYADKTLLHNVLSCGFSNEMGNYASRTRFCEVFLNGVYQGNYVIMEKVKRGSNRVNISKMATTDTTGNNVTGGYIVKIDKFTGSGGDGFYSNYPSSNSTGSDPIYYQFDYPKAEDIVPKQAAYIQSYVDSFEAALYGPGFTDTANGFRKFANEKSFMDYMFIDELSKNVDGYRLSTYFYKNKRSKGGKLVAGPCWDYDIAWDNADYCEAYIDTGWEYLEDYVCQGAAVPAHWERMRQDTLFNARVYCRWKALRQGILSNASLFAYVDSMVALINESQVRNFQRWPELGIATWPEPQPNPATYSAEIQRLKTWITNRTAWLDNQIYSFPHYDLYPHIGNDTSLCPGNHTLLKAGLFGNYSWSTGATQSSITANSAGLFSVTVSDDFGCSGSSQINVSYFTAPTVTLGSDTAICQGDSVSLDAGNFNTYAWSTGAGTESIIINQPATYSVSVVDVNGCAGTGHRTLSVNNLPIVNLGSDTAICQGDSLSLDAGNFDTYAWSTGAGTESIIIDQPATYSVSVVDVNGCAGTGQRSLSVNNLPIVNLGSDTAICQGDSVSLDAGNFNTYAWSTGAGTESIIIDQPATYSVSVIDVNGCAGTGHRTLSVNSLPVVNLGTDTAICQGDSLNLDAGNFSTYLWSNGAATGLITANQGGTYSVSVTDANGCSATGQRTLGIQTLPDSTFTVTHTSATLYTFQADTQNAVLYAWDFGDGVTGFQPAALHNYTTPGSYTVVLTVTDSLGCTSSSSSAINVVITGIIKSFGNDLTISPNPAHDELMVNSKTLIIEAITITDITGKVISRYPVTTTTLQVLNISNLSNGIYFVEVTAAGAVYKERFVKN